MNKRAAIFVVIAIAESLLYITALFQITKSIHSIKSTVDTAAVVVERYLYSMYMDVDNSLVKKHTLFAKRYEKYPMTQIRNAAQFILSYADNASFPGISNNGINQTDDDIIFNHILVAKKNKDKSDFIIDFDYTNVLFKVNIFKYWQTSSSSTSYEWNSSLYALLKRSAIYYHDMDYLQYANDAFTYLEKVNSDDVELLAWHGSALTKYALHERSSIAKMEYVSKGTKMIDTAVYNSPSNFVIRFIRINNYFTLPRFLNKLDIGMRDLQFLVTAYTSGEKLQQYDTNGKVSYSYVPHDELKKALQFAVSSKETTKQIKDRSEEILRTFDSLEIRK